MIGATLRVLASGLVLFGIAGAQVSTFQSEAAYLSSLTGLGYTTFTEGFENDAVWGPARNPLAAASVTSQGVIWTSNHPNAVTRPSRVSTAGGPARSGSYGFFSLPHGDPDVTSPTGLMRDGFIGARVTGATPLYGVGLWLSGFAGSRVRLILDGNEAGSIEVGAVDAAHRFFGVIAPAGFRKFEVRETEGKLEDQKFIFADDFTFALKPGDVGTVTSVSSASFARSPLAAGSIASAYGDNLSASVAQTPSENLPANLAGTEVRFRDSLGVERLAPLLFVSPAQINYLVPAASAIGAATLGVTRGGQVVATGLVQVAAVAPGVFSANMDGRGPAAAWGIRRSPDQTDTYQLTFQCGTVAGSCATSPIDLGGVNDQAFLSLYGTGIRGRSAQSAVSARIGGVDSEVTYAGPQGFYPGLDQVNIRLPRTLLGRGEVDVLLTVDGIPSNAVKVSIH